MRRKIIETVIFVVNFFTFGKNTTIIVSANNYPTKKDTKNLIEKNQHGIKKENVKPGAIFYLYSKDLPFPFWYVKVINVIGNSFEIKKLLSPNSEWHNQGNFTSDDYVFNNLSPISEEQLKKTITLYQIYLQEKKEKIKNDLAAFLKVPEVIARIK